MTNPPRPQTVAFFALACGVAATLAAWYLVGGEQKAEQERAFEAKSQVMASAVERRMQRYLDVLYGLDALANHEPVLSRLEFHTYVTALDLGGRHPVVQSVE